MKNKMIKGLVALGMLLAGLAVVNTGSNVEPVDARWSCVDLGVPSQYCLPNCNNHAGLPPGDIHLNIGCRPLDIELDFED